MTTQPKLVTLKIRNALANFRLRLKPIALPSSLRTNEQPSGSAPQRQKQVELHATHMPGTIIVAGQYDSEGMGKVTSLLTRDLKNHGPLDAAQTTTAASP